MKIYLFIIGLLFPIVLFAQKIEGKVTDTKNEALIGASVYWLDNSQGTMTEINGNFSIEFNENSNKKLVASYVGYKSDTIEITNQKYVKFKLAAIKSLSEVVITEERDGIILSSFCKSASFSAS